MTLTERMYEGEEPGTLVKEADDALTAANERIRELEADRDVWRADLLDSENRAKRMAAYFIAEREVSDKLTVALQVAVSTCFTEYANHKYMSDPESPIRALLSEVEAIRKGNQ